MLLWAACSANLARLFEVLQTFTTPGVHPALLCAALLLGACWASEGSAAPSATAETAKASGSVLLVEVSGMTCVGCASKVRSALESVPGVASALVSTHKGVACVKTEASVSSSAMGEALLAAGYALVRLDSTERCPEDIKVAFADPWDHRGQGLDVVTISRGEEVELDQHIVADKYTVIDFGAPWCSPCHDAAETLQEYLTSHPDVAIRAVSLDGQDPETSYNQPVVGQHLAYVKGVPWFLVHAPGGKLIYKGMDVKRVLSVIERHRKRGGQP